MTDCFHPARRSEIMSRIRSRGNATTELRFITILRKNKITGWRRSNSLPGSPDFVFPALRMAVFIDGDFWHGNPKKYRIPKSNSAYWLNKIEGNKRRDRKVNRVLRSMGWKVVRFWESGLREEDIVNRRLSKLFRPRSMMPLPPLEAPTDDQISIGICEANCNKARCFQRGDIEIYFTR